MRRRQLKYKSLLGLLFGALLLMAYTSSSDDTDKTINMNFKVTPPIDLVLDNEYGDVTINTWSKNEVDISVEIRAQSRIKSYANKFVKETDIDFIQKGNKVYAKTKLGTRKPTSKWFSWLTGNQTYEVNYFVHIPEYTNLNIKNNYGDVTIDQYDGDLELDVSYGDVNTGYITGTADLDVKHGDIMMKGLGNGSIKLSFSEFRTEKAGNLELKTTDSELEIPEALNLTVFSKYDHYNIGSIDNLVNEGAYDEFDIIKARSIDMNTRYTELSVALCEVKFDIDMTFGETTIDHISAAFDGGSINGDDADIDLTFDGGVFIDLITEHTQLGLSKELINNSDITESNTRKISAIKGIQSDAKILTVRMSHGAFELK